MLQRSRRDFNVSKQSKSLQIYTASLHWPFVLAVCICSLHCQLALGKFALRADESLQSVEATFQLEIFKTFITASYPCH